MPGTPATQTAFTTWRALYEKLREGLADGSWALMSGYSVAGRTVNYRSFTEFRAMLEWVKDQADLEDGVRPYRRRTYAGNRGCGC